MAAPTSPISLDDVKLGTCMTPAPPNGVCVSLREILSKLTLPVFCAVIVYTRTSPAVAPSANAASETVFVTVNCPAGDRSVFNGSFDVMLSASNGLSVAKFPSPSEEPVTVESDGSLAATLAAFNT